MKANPKFKARYERAAARLKKAEEDVERLTPLVPLLKDAQYFKPLSYEDCYRGKLCGACIDDAKYRCGKPATWFYTGYNEDTKTQYIHYLCDPHSQQLPFPMYLFLGKLKGKKDPTPEEIKKASIHHFEKRTQQEKS